MLNFQVTFEDSISINCDDNQLEIEAQSETRDYYHIINLPPEADTKGWKYGFLNGLLEITVQKKGKKKEKQVKGWDEVTQKSQNNKETDNHVAICPAYFSAYCFPSSNTTFPAS